MVGIAFLLLAASPLAALRVVDGAAFTPAAARIGAGSTRDHGATDARSDAVRAPVVVDRVDAWWHPLHACRRPRSGTVAAMERLIACEAMTWAAPGGPAKAIDVAWCESRLRPAALNPTGCSGAGCGGLFQQHLEFWAARARRFGVPGRSAFDPWANAVVSVRMAAQQGTWRRDWPICGRGG